MAVGVCRPSFSSELINGTDGPGRGQSSKRHRLSATPDQASDTLYAHVFATSLGWIGVLGGDSGLVAVRLGESSEPETWSRLEATACELGSLSLKCSSGSRGLPAALADAVRTLSAYCRDGGTDLSVIRIDYRFGTQLQRRIWDATRMIAPGQTLSYKELAERVGLPRGARPTGQAMARNRLLLVVPCHRVVSSSGALTGYSNPQGLNLKQKLLDHESSAGTR